MARRGRAGACASAHPRLLPADSEPWCAGLHLEGRSGRRDSHRGALDLRRRALTRQRRHARRRAPAACRATFANRTGEGGTSRGEQCRNLTAGQRRAGPPSRTGTVPARRRSSGYTWQEAISNAGSALVATTSGVPTEPIWLHPAGARCPSFGRKIAVGHGEILGMIAGHKGTFHIAWDNAKSELEITSARVACSAR